MKKKSTALLFICWFALKTFAQSSDCILTATQLMELVGAKKDKQEDILLPCFRVEKADIDDAIKYRRNYGLHGLEYDYDIFYILPAPYNAVYINTINVNTYVKYKGELKKYGFKYSGEVHQKSIFKYKKYEMATSTGHNGRNNTVYEIKIE